jgi:uncharacterized membrane protein
VKNVIIGGRSLMYRMLWSATATVGMSTMFMLAGMTLWRAVLMASAEQGPQAVMLLIIGSMTTLLLFGTTTIILDAITRREIRARQRSTR